MDELDFLFAEGGVDRVVFEFLGEFVAEDEVALAFVQVGGDEVFGAELEQHIVEFGRRGFGEGGQSCCGAVVRWCARAARVGCLPVFLWTEDEAVKERVWVLRRRALTAER